ncbi:MAG: flagellar basal body L-ring protein FlgH [Planctomycetota bacterium]
MKRRMLLIAIIWVLTASTAHGQSGSLYRQARVDPEPAQTDEAAGKTTVERPSVRSLTAPPRAEPRTFREEDLITIIIREAASHATNGSVSTSRESSIDATVDAWVRLHAGTHGMIRPVDFEKGKPAVKADGEREFEGEGKASRTDTMTARITGRIIDIRPNGNLVLEAVKEITTEGETYTITVTGVCRTGDITPDNTVLSTQVADLNVVKTATGAVRSATKRGWLHRLADALNLF